MLQTLGKISTGFLCGLVFGIILAVISSISEFMKMLFLPLLKLIKSIPVASFIILALLWIRSSNLSILISFLMVLPIIYINVLQGIESVDIQLLEMSKIFRMGHIRRICYIYIPHVLPFLISACRIGLGFCFKSGIAAEIIGLPSGSIGEHLYKAKLYLMTDELFAWTIVIVLASVLYEFVCMQLIQLLSNIVMKLSSRYSGYGHHKSKTCSIHQVKCESISKAYDTQTILSDFSYTFTSEKTTCILGSSGIGKTTLLNIIAGICPPDSGSVEFLMSDSISTSVSDSVSGSVSSSVSGSATCSVSDSPAISMVFQEDRLLNDFDAFTNIQAVYGNTYDKDYIRKHFDSVCLSDYDGKCVQKLSGGMKRRIAIVRAVLSDAPVLLLDEPLKGLDASVKNSVIRYLREQCNDKVIILVTHDKEDIASMDGIELELA